MTIPVRQSELDRIGFKGSFTQLRYYDRARVAAQALNAAGRQREAFLLEIGNPNAMNGIYYVADTLRGNLPGIPRG